MSSEWTRLLYSFRVILKLRESTSQIERNERGIVKGFWTENAESSRWSGRASRVMVVMTCYNKVGRFVIIYRYLRKLGYFSFSYFSNYTCYAQMRS